MKTSMEVFNVSMFSASSSRGVWPPAANDYKTNNVIKTVNLTETINWIEQLIELQINPMAQN